MKNKRGQDVNPLPVVVGIILLLAVAGVLILGFTKGWQVFEFWIPSNNVQTIATQCNIACVGGNQYDFCTLPRTLNDPTQKNKNGFDANGVLPVTCKDFSDTTKATALGGYKIPACPSLTC
ncbi:MAG TPA: hypothetical protein VMC80_01265 [Patescibacteria group bacterium]|nr:hypothetical protein [Patescibacteria group bacterium]